MAGVCEEECMGRWLGDELLTLTRYHSCKLSVGENLSVADPTTLKGIKVKNFFFFVIFVSL